MIKEMKSGIKESKLKYTRQHPQTRESKCVYHGTRCLVSSDGEIVCRIFGNVIKYVEDVGLHGAEPREFTTGHFSHNNAKEFLGTVNPVLNVRSNKLHMKRDANALWYQRIQKIADQFNIKKSLRDDIEFVFTLLRRKTSHRPSLILFFAFYNTCREHGAAAINEEELRNVICHCCNLKSMYTILKVYSIFAIEAQKLGIYKTKQTTGFYFNAFLRSATKSLELDSIDRRVLEHGARRKYLLLPPSMGEKARSKSAFLSVLGARIFEKIREDVRY